MPFDAISSEATYDLTTGRGRLAYLADVVLERVRVQELPFDLDYWFEQKGNEHDCGTVACAVGWAARDRLLQEQGLSIRSNAFYSYPVFDQVAEYMGLADFFDLRDPVFQLPDEDTAKWLFLPSRYDEDYVRPEHVQARIREYLAQPEIDHAV